MRLSTLAVLLMILPLAALVGPLDLRLADSRSSSIASEETVKSPRQQSASHSAGADSRSISQSVEEPLPINKRKANATVKQVERTKGKTAAEKKTVKQGGYPYQPQPYPLPVHPAEGQEAAEGAEGAETEAPKVTDIPEGAVGVQPAHGVPPAGWIAVRPPTPAYPYGPQPAYGRPSYGQQPHRPAPAGQVGPGQPPVAGHAPGFGPPATGHRPWRWWSRGEEEGEGEEENGEGEEENGEGEEGDIYEQWEEYYEMEEGDYGPFGQGPPHGQYPPGPQPGQWMPPPGRWATAGPPVASPPGATGHPPGVTGAPGQTGLPPQQPVMGPQAPWQRPHGPWAAPPPTHAPASPLPPGQTHPPQAQQPTMIYPPWQPQPPPRPPMWRPFWWRPTTTTAQPPATTAAPTVAAPAVPVVGASPPVVAAPAGGTVGQTAPVVATAPAGTTGVVPGATEAAGPTTAGASPTEPLILLGTVPMESAAAPAAKPTTTAAPAAGTTTQAAGPTTTEAPKLPTMVVPVWPWDVPWRPQWQPTTPPAPWWAHPPQHTPPRPWWAQPPPPPHMQPPWWATTPWWLTPPPTAATTNDTDAVANATAEATTDAVENATEAAVNVTTTPKPITKLADPNRFSGVRNFTCPVSRIKSEKPPPNVNSVRIGDIRVIGVIGGSLLSGFGSGAANLSDLRHEWRGYSAATGGEETLSTFSSLPNIIRRLTGEDRRPYTGDDDDGMQGLSYGVSNVTRTIKGLGKVPEGGLNVAIGAAFIRHADAMAREMVKRIMRLRELETHDWKLISINLGSLDLDCYCCFGKMANASDMASHLRQAIDTLALLPRTIVNIIPPANTVEMIETTPSYTEHFTCRKHRFSLFNPSKCVANDSMAYLDIYGQFREEIDQIEKDYSNRDDFAVVVQNFDMLPKEEDGSMDFAMFAPDCGHLSVYGQSRVGIGLFNSLLTPADAKFEHLTTQTPVMCPNASCPFIRTLMNTQDCASFYTNGTAGLDMDADFEEKETFPAPAQQKHIDQLRAPVNIHLRAVAGSGARPIAGGAAILGRQGGSGVSTVAGMMLAVGGCVALIGVVVVGGMTARRRTYRNAEYGEELLRGGHTRPAGERTPLVKAGGVGCRQIF